MKRFWEIDSDRGTTIIFMILFNWLFALTFLNIIQFQASREFWYLAPRIIGAMFIFIAGISLSLSYSRRKSFSHLLKRGGKIFMLGFGITILTFMTFPQQTIWFGILHLIGLSIILSSIFLKYPKFILPSAIIIMTVGFFLESMSFSFSYLLWLGFPPAGFMTFDYFPLLPWFSFMLLGIYAGQKLYKNNKRNFSLPIKENIITKFLCFLGRHSLLIYVIHQPFLIALLMVLGFRIF